MNAPTVDLWFCLTADVIDPSLQRDYRSLLSPEEQERMGRYIFPEHRLEFLLTRAMVRTLLSQYEPRVAPEEWTFLSNAYGKPAVRSPPAGDLHFNLSNTRGLVACAISRGIEIGVDAEYEARSGETIEIADSFFSPRECRDLRALPEDAQRKRFFDLWTLKEAYIKARGMGLSIPLSQFSFVFEAGRPEIVFEASLEDCAQNWQFYQARPTPDHAVALAVQKKDDRDRNVQIAPWLPLRRGL